MNFGDLFNSAKESIEKAFDDVVATGVPAIQSAAEKQAIAWLQKQNEATQSELEKNVQEIMNRPTEPGSFSETLQSVVSAPIMKEYGLYIVVGVVGLLFAGMYLRK